MQVVQVINWHRFGGGSDFVAQSTADLLRRKGHGVVMVEHDSRSLEGSVGGKMAAFGRGMYSPRARSEMRALLRSNKPDLVHVHELYPFHSPWILKDCHDAGVPVVMTCHDYRLTCPVATHLSHGEICVRCAGGGTHWCAIRNCRGRRLESVAYAARGAVAHQFGLFRRYVSEFITPSRFLRDRLSAAGYPGDRFSVVNNMVEYVADAADPAAGQYIAYAGRIAPEKGIDTLIDAVQRTGLPLRIAGGERAHFGNRGLPDSVSFVGHLNALELANFYRGARMIVVPSRWWEVFGLVAAEAMMHGIPVIASRIGALPEVVDDAESGFLFEPGNADDLAMKMQTVWDDPAVCRSMGERGRKKAQEHYTAAPYYHRLMAVYRRAIAGARVEAAEPQEAGVV